MVMVPGQEMVTVSAQEPEQGRGQEMVPVQVQAQESARAWRIR